jgi:hypothetical protein
MSVVTENPGVPEDAAEPHTPTAEGLTLSPPTSSNVNSIISTSPDTANTLVALCSFQGFGPDWLVFDTGDVVKLLNLHESGWCNVQRLSDGVVATVPHGRFVSQVKIRIDLSHLTFLLIIFPQKTSSQVDPVSTSVADTGDATSSTPDPTDTLEAMCSVQGFGPDWLVFVAGDVVQLLDQHASGWWKVRRISDDAIGVGPSNYFVSTLCFNVQDMVRWLKSCRPSIIHIQHRLSQR